MAASKRISSGKKSDGLSASPLKRQKTEQTTSPPSAKSKKSVQKQKQKPELKPEQEEQELRAWLDKQDKAGKGIFHIKHAPVMAKGKKRKSVSGEEEQLSLGGRPTVLVQYSITPMTRWEQLKKFRNFTVGDETIGVGQVVLVKHSAESAKAERDEMEIASQWKAQVHEVRAIDSSHVYLRVTWLNRPEDLPNGGRNYHGRHELIPTNDMTIIDAMSVNGALPVVHWDEYADDDAMIEEDQYFWRQTYDVHSGLLSKCRTVCKCEQPHNPDEMLLQCSSAACRKWLHVKCIIEDALDAAKKSQTPASHPQTTTTPPEDVNGDGAEDDSTAADTPQTKTKGKRKSSSKKTKQSMVQSAEASVKVGDEAPRNLLEADVLLKGKSEDGAALRNRIVLVDRRSGEVETREQDVACLICGTTID